MSHPLSTAALCLTLCSLPVHAQDAAPAENVMRTLEKAASFFHPQAGAPARSLHLSGEVMAGSGIGESLKGATFDLRMEPPRYLKLDITAAGRHVVLCQEDDKVWIHVPDKKMLIVGDAATPRFSGRADSVQPVVMSLFPPPVNRAKLMMVPALVSAATSTAASGARTITLTPSPAAAAVELPMKNPKLTATLNAGSPWPETLDYEDAANKLTLRLAPLELTDAQPASVWQPKPAADDRVETVALVHLQRFFQVTMASLGSRITTLPPAKGERWLVGTAGAGRLEDHDSTRVLFLSGTPEEMGRQHGTLLKKEIRRVVDRILYGVGVGSSFE
ncbi:MAG: hypothetical protein JWL81_3405, partial [Verrucomicrobiales bacterium]|nr:hypothetical protein [Verrucomicrobiales bacterium]